MQPLIVANHHTGGIVVVVLLNDPERLFDLGLKAIHLFVAEGVERVDVAHFMNR